MDEDRRVYGYARVSSKDQNLARQMVALRDFPVREDCIFSDKSSGKDFDRPGYQNLVKTIRHGDLVVVKSVDRLGRNYDDIQAQWRLITRDVGADIVVIDMPLLDTRTNQGGLTGVFISDLVLQVLSYVAQMERDEIKQRQAEGISAAKSRGVRFGRPVIVPPDSFANVLERFEGGMLDGAHAAQELGVSRPTFYKWRRLFCEKSEHESIR